MTTKFEHIKFHVQQNSKVVTHRVQSRRWIFAFVLLSDTSCCCYCCCRCLRFWQTFKLNYGETFKRFESELTCSVVSFSPSPFPHYASAFFARVLSCFHSLLRAYTTTPHHTTPIRFIKIDKRCQLIGFNWVRSIPHKECTEYTHTHAMFTVHCIAYNGYVRAYACDMTHHTTRTHRVYMCVSKE